jgi:hypothetical protein
LLQQRKMATDAIVPNQEACLARRHYFYSTNDIAVCAYCKAIRYGRDPADVKCCKWLYCNCESDCNPIECAACGILQRVKQAALYKRCPMGIVATFDWDVSWSRSVDKK